jgi:hypothetical protein
VENLLLAAVAAGALPNVAAASSLPAAELREIIPLTAGFW